MHSLLFPFFVVSSILVSRASPLPYIFDRAVSDTTSLAPTPQNVQRQLGPLLARGASIYFPGSPQFQNASSRWSSFGAPNIAVVVEPGNARDVATTVRYPQSEQVRLQMLTANHVGLVREQIRDPVPGNEQRPWLNKYPRRAQKRH